VWGLGFKVWGLGSRVPEFFWQYKRPSDFWLDTGPGGDLGVVSPSFLELGVVLERYAIETHPERSPGFWRKACTLGKWGQPLTQD